MDLMTEKTCNRICQGLTHKEVSWIFDFIDMSLDPTKILHRLCLHEFFETKEELFRWVVVQVFNSWGEEYK